MRKTTFLAGTLFALACAVPAFAATLRVGPAEEIRTLSEAAMRAQDGDTVEVVAGEYRGDVAVWKQKRITIRGVGGRPRLLAMGFAAENKAIFVVRGEQAHIENIEFVGTRVPDRNGAGIRLEAGALVVVDCRFIDNENGILTANDERISLTVRGSEFGHNGAGDGQSHNLYAGAIGLLDVRGSYFHHARVGHLLKSRAKESRIYYNRLTDETGGQASYELEFPSGGRAIVVGNLIQQAGSSENSTIVSIGAEGPRWPVNRLFLAHNTLVNDRPQGVRTLDLRKGVSGVLINNLLLGPGMTLDSVEAIRRGNAIGTSADLAASRGDELYHLREGSPLRGAAAPAGRIDEVELTPDAEYVHPLQTRRIAPSVWSPGAYQSTQPTPSASHMGRERFPTSARDLAGHLADWSAGLALLDDPLNWVFGKGTGRYPASFFLSRKAKDQVGDYRLREDGSERYLVLTGGTHPADWGELFRISQRVASFAGPVSVRADVRSAMTSGLHFEICRKHLLYDDGACVSGDQPVSAQAGKWQPVVLQLPGAGLSRGDFFAPHFITFSVGVNTSGGRVELDNISARDSGGRELLANGDFAGGMARWFFSSDRYHLPWHTNNIFVHVLFEQGSVGLVLFSALVLAALWRVSVGTARDHSMSAALFAAILGFLVVGLFDSLLDAPRVALLFYLTLLVALGLPGEIDGPTMGERAPQ